MISSLSQRAIVPTWRLMTPIGVKLSDITSTTTTTTSTTSCQFTTFPSNNKCVVVHTIGKDRPGIVADVTRIVTAKGGNVGESHSQLVGGHFSLMMLVEIPSAENNNTTLEGLQDQLRKEVEGMSSAECLEAVDPRKVEVCPTIGFAGHFKLSGADNPGIVHKLTTVLAANSLTIGNMKTSREEAPFGGTELFTMEGKSVAYEPLASNFDWLKIKEELQEMGESMNCDVEFDEVTKS